VVLPPDTLELVKLQKHLNGILGPTCFVRELVPVPDGFHARFSAVERCYRYQLIRRFSPLRRATHWFVESDLDLEVIDRATTASRGEHDFGMFCAHSRQMAHTRCTVSAFSTDLDPPYLVFRIAADRFLHHMVRRLVGEMVLLGQGRRTLQEYLARLDQPGPGEAGLTAPPHALFLEEVRYPTQGAAPARSDS
jgi:tRNA pseudouridine38-40 synthase